jgi:serine/threonine-protein kinase
MDPAPKVKAKAVKKQAIPERLGKYQLSGVVGKGAMGVVYKSFDPDIKRPVALKTIRRELLDEDGAESFSARFRNEAQAAGGLIHPGIVAIYEYGEEDGYAYIAMELVEGHSLREYFEQKVPFAISQVVSIVSQLLEALQYAHERGVWHRDIKPANILIMSDGRIKVTDFGIARIESSTLTQMGAILGTPGFIAPELYLSSAFDCRIDVFAAGVVLYQLLAGVPPYGGTPENVMYKVCYEAPVPPSVAGNQPSLQPYDAIVLRALAKRPDERFPSALQFRDALIKAHVQDVNPAGLDETIVRPGPSEAPIPLPRTRAPATPPVSTATLVDRGWDMDELVRIEKRLARFIGPIARVMVRRGAKEARDIPSLVDWLAARIKAPAERKEFLQGLGLVRSPATTLSSGGTGEQATIIAPPPGTKPRTSRPLTPEDVARAARLLAVHMGPIAQILAKRAAQPGTGREEFAASLGAYLTDDADRARFFAAFG